MTGIGLTNKTIGIIGLGANGFNIAKRMKGFDIGQMLYNDLTELEDKGMDLAKKICCSLHLSWFFSSIIK